MHPVRSSRRSLAPPSRLGACALALALAAALGTPAWSQGSRPPLEGRVEGKGFTKIPIAIPSADGTAPRASASEFVETVRDDLAFSGFFDVIDPRQYRLVPPRGATHEDWRGIGADALVRTKLAIAGEDVDATAWVDDTASGTAVLAKRYGGEVDYLRRVAHTLSNDIIEHYTGRPGVAMTRIAFTSKHGSGKEIYLMDYDGHRVRRLTTTGTINLAPTWSPDGEELAYLSYRGKQPGVYVMSSQGELRQLTLVSGELTAAPDWSPDGKRIAYASDAPGNLEIYVLDRASGKSRRLTHNAAIETAPAFSPNGREIAFTSDRAGGPQIYVMDAEGLNVRRVSLEGSYNDSAAWSPRGDKMVYVSRIDGRFDIVSLDLQGGGVTRLTRGEGNSENPRWSPDGRHIVFASDRTGTWDIYTMSADGRDVRRLTKGADAYTPDWSR
jgi:TolB protein